MDLGPLVVGVRKGLEKCQRGENTTPERLPLPAPVALSILEGAKHLLLSVHWAPRDPRLQLMRASVASITSYFFFNRGGMQCPLSRGRHGGDQQLHHAPAKRRERA